MDMELPITFCLLLPSHEFSFLIFPVCPGSPITYRPLLHTWLCSFFHQQLHFDAATSTPLMITFLSGVKLQCFFLRFCCCCSSCCRKFYFIFASLAIEPARYASGLFTSKSQHRMIPHVHAGGLQCWRSPPLPNFPSCARTNTCRAGGGASWQRMNEWTPGRGTV